MFDPVTALTTNTIHSRYKCLSHNVKVSSGGQWSCHTYNFPYCITRSLITIFNEMNNEKYHTDRTDKKIVKMGKISGLMQAPQ